VGGTVIARRLVAVAVLLFSFGSSADWACKDLGSAAEFGHGDSAEAACNDSAADPVSVVFGTVPSPGWYCDTNEGIHNCIVVCKCSTVAGTPLYQGVSPDAMGTAPAMVNAGGCTYARTGAVSLCTAGNGSEPAQCFGDYKGTGQCDGGPESDGSLDFPVASYPYTTSAVDAETDRYQGISDGAGGYLTPAGWVSASGGGLKPDVRVPGVNDNDVDGDGLNDDSADSDIGPPVASCPDTYVQYENLCIPHGGAVPTFVFSGVVADSGSGSSDICADNPDILACEESGTLTGTVPGTGSLADLIDDPISTGTAGVEWSSWFAAAGGACEMTFTGSIMGASADWDFCEFLDPLRVFLAWVFGLFTVVAIGRVWFGDKT